VHIEEHKPIARWGDRSLVTSAFKLFSPPQLDGVPEPELQEVVDSLPVLYSPERRHVALLKLLNVVIGHREVHKRIKRFSEIFRPYVAPVYDDIAKVDMRYTNGFAMARKSAVSDNLRVQ